MKHSEFTIGEHFFCGGHKYLCTDKGTRTIACIRVDEPFMIQDPTWLNGPPYAVEEKSFDEYDMTGCTQVEVCDVEALAG